MSEAALAEDWSRAEEDEAWAHLQGFREDIPEIPELNPRSDLRAAAQSQTLAQRFTGLPSDAM